MHPRARFPHPLYTSPLFSLSICARAVCVCVCLCGRYVVTVNDYLTIVDVTDESDIFGADDVAAAKPPPPAAASEAKGASAPLITEVPVPVGGADAGKAVAAAGAAAADDLDGLD